MSSTIHIKGAGSIIPESKTETTTLKLEITASKGNPISQALAIQENATEKIEEMVRDTITDFINTVKKAESADPDAQNRQNVLHEIINSLLN